RRANERELVTEHGGASRRAGCAQRHSAQEGQERGGRSGGKQRWMGRPRRLEAAAVEVIGLSCAAVAGSRAVCSAVTTTTTGGVSGAGSWCLWQDGPRQGRCAGRGECSRLCPARRAEVGLSW